MIKISEQKNEMYARKMVSENEMYARKMVTENEMQ